LAGLNSNNNTALASSILHTNKITFHPDARLCNKARQTFFLGLAFSTDGKHKHAEFQPDLSVFRFAQKLPGLAADAAARGGARMAAPPFDGVHCGVPQPRAFGP
jgi:hypothetical protein